MGGLLSQDIAANRFVFTSDAITQDLQTGKPIPGDIEEQAVSKTTRLAE